jgi:O-antigen/teichoic acid export membrane protein
MRILASARDVPIALIGNLSLAALQWLLVLLVARVSGPVGAGTLALATAIVTPLALLCGLGLKVIAATSQRSESQGAEFIVVSTLGAMALAVTGLACASLPGLSADVARVVLVISLVRGVENVIDVLNGMQLARGGLTLVAKSMIVRATLCGTLFSIVFLTTRSLVFALTGVLVGQLSVLLLRDLPNAALSGAKFVRLVNTSLRSPDQRRSLADVARHALPLGIASVLYSLTTMMPRYFIEVYAGRAALGMFSAGSLLMAGGELIVRSQNQASGAALSRESLQPRSKEFRGTVARLLLAAVAVAGVAMIAAVFFGPLLLGFLFGPGFAEGHSLLIAIAVVALPAYLAASIGYVLTSLGIMRAQSVAIAVAVAVNLVSALAMVPRWGTFGAVAAWGIAICIPLFAGLAIVWSRTRSNGT